MIFCLVNVAKKNKIKFEGILIHMPEVLFVILKLRTLNFKRRLILILERTCLLGKCVSMHL